MHCETCRHGSYYEEGHYTVPQKQEAQHVILGRICWASTFFSGRSRRAWLTALKNSGRLWATGVIPSCHPEEDIHPIMRHLSGIGGLPVTRIGINECLSFINHPVYGVLLQQTYKTKTDSLKFFSGLRFGRVDPRCPVPSSGIGTRARYLYQSQVWYRAGRIIGLVCEFDKVMVGGAGSRLVSLCITSMLTGEGFVTCKNQLALRGIASLGIRTQRPEQEKYKNIRKYSQYN